MNTHFYHGMLLFRLLFCKITVSVRLFTVQCSVRVSSVTLDGNGHLLQKLKAFAQLKKRGIEPASEASKFGKRNHCTFCPLRTKPVKSSGTHHPIPCAYDEFSIARRFKVEVACRKKRFASCKVPQVETQLSQVVAC